MSREKWEAFAEMGLLGLAIPENYGGAEIPSPRLLWSWKHSPFTRARAVPGHSSAGRQCDRRRRQRRAEAGDPALRVRGPDLPRICGPRGPVCATRRYSVHHRLDGR
nr:acyl-CoA dehydrogenase family protein [Brevibacterium sp. UCMA 11754]